MDKVIEMLQTRQGTQSLNAFARELGLWPSTLWRYYRNEREMSMTIVRILVRHFTKRGDFDALATLTAYAFGGVYEEESS